MCFLCSPLAAFSQGTDWREKFSVQMQEPFITFSGLHLAAAVSHRALRWREWFGLRKQIYFEKPSTVISSFFLTVPQRHFILIMQEVAEALWYYSFKIKTLKLQCDDFQIFQAFLPPALIASLLFLLQSYLLFQYAVLVQCCTKPLLFCSKKSFSLCKWHRNEFDKVINSHILWLQLLGFCLVFFTVNFVEGQGFTNSLLASMQ